MFPRPVFARVICVKMGHAAERSARGPGAAAIGPVRALSASYRNDGVVHLSEFPCLDSISNGLVALKSLWADVRAWVTARTSAHRGAVPWVAGVVIFLLLIYYPLGMLIYDRVDDDIRLKPEPGISPCHCGRQRSRGDRGNPGRAGNQGVAAERAVLASGRVRSTTPPTFSSAFYMRCRGSRSNSAIIWDACADPVRSIPISITPPRCSATTATLGTWGQGQHHPHGQSGESVP